MRWRAQIAELSTFRLPSFFSADILHLERRIVSPLILFLDEQGGFRVEDFSRREWRGSIELAQSSSRGCTWAVSHSLIWPMRNSLLLMDSVMNLWAAIVSNSRQWPLMRR